MEIFMAVLGRRQYNVTPSLAPTSCKSLSLGYPVGASSLTDWLLPEAFTQKIRPMFANVATSAISITLGISWVYASHIRAGAKRPHPRHWLKLTEFVEVSSD
jgi:hypothetical protein